MEYPRIRHLFAWLGRVLLFDPKFREADTSQRGGSPTVESQAEPPADVPAPDCFTDHSAQTSNPGNDFEGSGRTRRRATPGGLRAFDLSRFLTHGTQEAQTRFCSIVGQWANVGMTVTKAISATAAGQSRATHSGLLPPVLFRFAK